MRFLPALFWFLALPAFAQTGVQARRYNLEDSTEVLRILKEGKQLLQGGKTKIVSAQYFGDAFRLSQLIGFYRGQGEALRLLGMLSVEQKAGYSYEAMEYFRKSLDVWQDSQDLYEILGTYHAIGDIFSERWHLHKESVGYYRQALLLAEKMHKPSEAQHILLKMVRIFIEIDDAESATRYAHKLEKLYKKQGMHEAITELKLDLAQYWAKKQDFKKAQELAKEAQRNFSTHGGAPQQFATYLEALKHHRSNTEAINASRLTLAAITVLVIGLILLASYFYARREVRQGRYY